jgi:5-oxoprolinase (ATP-hydrolysing)
MRDVALGFVDVANEAMCRPIRALTQARGLDVSQHVLACFGGAGGQHACAIARQLGMKTVFVHRYASILSAVGMGLASIVQEEQVRLPLAATTTCPWLSSVLTGILMHLIQPTSVPQHWQHFAPSLNCRVIIKACYVFQEPAARVLDSSSLQELQKRLDNLDDRARNKLLQRGFTQDQLSAQRFLNLRYSGTDVALMVVAEQMQDYESTFLEMYEREFGFLLQDRDIIVDDVRCNKLFVVSAAVVHCTEKPLHASHILLLADM